MLAENIAQWGYDTKFRRKHKKMAPISLKFDKNYKVVQIEGPNKRGKSEAWRTLHLYNALFNAGYPVPAKYAASSVVPASYFISCKGDRGYGGSELERSLNGIIENLKEVHDGDNVILDELGDATNASTAEELGRRLLPELVKRGCRVLVTSHHNALTDFIKKEMRGKSYMPDPKSKGINKYKIVPSSNKIDFKSEEVLDEIKFTSKKIRKTLPRKKILSRKRRDPPAPWDKHSQNHDDDVPF